MKALKIKDSQLESIFFEDSERFEVINKGEWEQDGKYQNCDFRFKDTTTDLIYQGSVTRSGSPFTDWNYMSDIGCNDEYTLSPVEEVEIKTTIFKEVSNDKITESEVIEEV